MKSNIVVPIIYGTFKRKHFSYSSHQNSAIPPNEPTAAQRSILKARGLSDMVDYRNIASRIKARWERREVGMWGGFQIDGIDEISGLWNWAIDLRSANEDGPSIVIIEIECPSLSSAQTLKSKMSMSTARREVVGWIVNRTYWGYIIGVIGSSNWLDKRDPERN